MYQLGRGCCPKIPLFLLVSNTSLICFYHQACCCDHDWCLPQCLMALFHHRASFLLANISWEGYVQDKIQNAETTMDKARPLYHSVRSSMQRDTRAYSERPLPLQVRANEFNKRRPWYNACYWRVPSSKVIDWGTARSRPNSTRA